MEKQLEAMKKLGLTDAEIEELKAFDKQVDRMKDSEVNSDLTSEQQKAVKKARQADRKPTVYNFNKRERKKDLAKREILQTVINSLTFAEGVEILNEEREFTFKVDGKKYKIVLSAPRS